MTNSQSRQCSHPPCNNVTTDPSGYCYLHGAAAAQNRAAAAPVPELSLSSASADDTPDLTGIDRSLWHPVVPGWRGDGDADALWDEYDSFVMGSDLSEAGPHDDKENATIFRVPNTSWGDYSGDAVQRANYESILEDYEGVVKSVDGGHNSHYLVVRGADLVSEDGAVMRALDTSDSGLYSDERYNDVKERAFDEDWHAWRFADVRSDVRDMLQQAPDEPLDADTADDVTDGLDADELLGIFREGLRGADDADPFYMEDAVSTHIPNDVYKQVMNGHVVPEVRRRALSKR